MSNLLKDWESHRKNFRHYLTSLAQTAKHGYPAKNLTVIGVTGTDGKTTTAHLIYEFLKAAKFKAALISTVGAWGSKGFIDTGLHTTTPDATVLQPLLNKFKTSGITHVVLEVTSHGLDQHRTLGANFYGAVLTNVTHEHLDYHKTLENYLEAKAKLFKRVKVAVLNKDDESFDYFKKKVRKGTKVISYSTFGLADIKATQVSESTKTLSFLASDNGVGYPIKTTLIGTYNVSNILAAIGVARHFGVPWKTIQKTIVHFGGILGRMEYIKKRPFSVIVDFAHTPNALKVLLQTLRARLEKKGRLISVFGCAGERDRAKRPMMGEISSKLSEVSIFTAEDPRSEDVNKIISQMMKGVKRGGKRVIKEPDRARAIETAVKIAKKGDIVVITGKGHELSMAFGKTEVPWSDQEQARKALSVL